MEKPAVDLFSPHGYNEVALRVDEDGYAILSDKDVNRIASAVVLALSSSGRKADSHSVNGGSIPPRATKESGNDM